jgi:hypothetical protein
VIERVRSMRWMRVGIRAWRRVVNWPSSTGPRAPEQPRVAVLEAAEAAVPHASQAGHPPGAGPLVVAPEGAGGQERRQRERDEQRRERRDRDHDRERADELARDAGRQDRQRQVDDHVDERDRDRGQADLAAPVQRRPERRPAAVEVAGDVLQHDDRVVDTRSVGSSSVARTSSFRRRAVLKNEKTHPGGIVESTPGTQAALPTRSLIRPAP